MWLVSESGEIISEGASSISVPLVCDALIDRMDCDLERGEDSDSPELTRGFFIELEFFAVTLIVDKKNDGKIIKFLKSFSKLNLSGLEIRICISANREISPKRHKWIAYDGQHE